MYADHSRVKEASCPRSQLREAKEGGTPVKTTLGMVGEEQNGRDMERERSRG
jgi:hypothetical protein